MGFAVLGRPMVPGIPWWVTLHTASTLIGIIGWIWATIHIGRRGLLRSWHGPPPLVATRPALFWTSVVMTMTPGAVASVMLPGGRIPIVFFERLLCVSAGALALTAVVVLPLSSTVSLGPGRDAER